MNTLFNKIILVLSMILMPGVNPVLSAADVDQNEPLIVTVDGRNVTADWSAMPDSLSYTLYYAYADYAGGVDMDTLGTIEMGQAKTIFAPMLPSGLIFYTAIMAHTGQADILSNIVKFMPFGGSVAYPETGDVLMQIDDPQGVGTVSIVGARNVDGSDDSISKITGTDDKSLYTLYLTDNQLTSYEADDFTINFIYKADGSVSTEIIMSNSQTVIKKASSFTVNNTIDCSKYKNADEYLSSAEEDILTTSRINFWNHQKSIGHFYLLELLFLNVSVESDYYQKNLQGYLASHRAATSEDFLQNDPYFKAYQIIVSGRKLLELTAPTTEETREDADQEYLEDYKKQCNTIIIETPVSTISLDISCPVPATAKAMDFCGKVTGTNEEFNAIYYILDGHSVGPKLYYDSCNTATQNLVYNKCFDIEGDNHGWYVEYETNGLKKTATHYEHGLRDGHKYDFSNGIVETDWWFEDGENTGYISYQADGRIQTCEFSAGIPKCVWDLSGFTAK